MSCWAEIDNNNVVVRVILTEDGPAGYEWIMGNLGGVWIETTETNHTRMAGPGMLWDEARDAFYFPKPDDGNPLWFFNEQTVQWELPAPVVEEIQLDPNWVAP